MKNQNPNKIDDVMAKKVKYIQTTNHYTELKRLKPHQKTTFNSGASEGNTSCSTKEHFRLY